MRLDMYWFISQRQLHSRKPQLPDFTPMRLLLIGAGHAHAQVLRDWAAAPVAGVEVVLVTPAALSPYSGRVPAWLAGRCGSFAEICIDFAALAAAAGARLMLGEVAALDAQAGCVRLRSGASLGYDWLSLNVGATLTPPPASAATRVLALRPLSQLQTTWPALLIDPALRDVGAAADPLRITMAGGGAAGVECLLAVLAQLRHLHPQRALKARLVSRSAQLIPGLAAGAGRAAIAALARAGVEVDTGADFDFGCAVGHAPGPAQPPDWLLWATGAEAHPWQAGSGLALGESGFVRVDAQLRSISHPNVFAAGDAAEWATPLPKSGVMAVRMGPVLSHNLRAAVAGGALGRFKPQRRSLALLATADGSAIAAWGGWSAHGRWVCHWKDHLDRQFLRRYALLKPRHSAV